MPYLIRRVSISRILDIYVESPYIVSISCSFFIVRSQIYSLNISRRSSFTYIEGIKVSSSAMVEHSGISLGIQCLGCIVRVIFPIPEPSLECLGVYYVASSSFIYVGGIFRELTVVFDCRFYLVGIECYIGISTAFPDVLIYKS